MKNEREEKLVHRQTGWQTAQHPQTKDGDNDAVGSPELA